MGVLVNKDMNIETDIYKAADRRVEFIEEQFENIVVRIPQCIAKSREVQ